MNKIQFWTGPNSHRINDRLAYQRLILSGIFATITYQLKDGLYTFLLSADGAQCEIIFS